MQQPKQHQYEDEVCDHANDVDEDEVGDHANDVDEDDIMMMMKIKMKIPELLFSKKNRNATT